MLPERPRFIAIRGEVWDQTATPAHPLALEEALRLVAIWSREADECRKRGAYELVRTWAVPATVLLGAIEQARAQRQMMGANYRPRECAP